MHTSRSVHVQSAPACTPGRRCDHTNTKCYRMMSDEWNVEFYGHFSSITRIRVITQGAACTSARTSCPALVDMDDVYHMQKVVPHLTPTLYGDASGLTRLLDNGRRKQQPLLFSVSYVHVSIGGPFSYTFPVILFRLAQPASISDSSRVCLYLPRTM